MWFQKLISQPIPLAEITVYHIAFCLHLVSGGVTETWWLVQHSARGEIEGQGAEKKEAFTPAKRKETLSTYIQDIIYLEIYLCWSRKGNYGTVLYWMKHGANTKDSLAILKEQGNCHV